jgi:hypothetical protein
MVFSLFKRGGRIAVLMALAAAIALTLMLMALGGRGPAAAHAAVKYAAKQSVTARDPDTLQVGDQTSPDPAVSATKAAASNDPAGNSQAGGPDTSSTSGESGVDSEQGAPGEPAVGHADPAGAAGSNCTGNCVQ